MKHAILSAGIGTLTITVGLTVVGLTVVDLPALAGAKAVPPPTGTITCASVAGIARFAPVLKTIASNHKLKVQAVANSCDVTGVIGGAGTIASATLKGAISPVTMDCADLTNPESMSLSLVVNFFSGPNGTGTKLATALATPQLGLSPLSLSGTIATRAFAGDALQLTAPSLAEPASVLAALCASPFGLSSFDFDAGLHLSSPAVAVSNTGTDSSTCGTSASPCATIDYAVTRASAQSMHEIDVAGGDYPAFTASDGINVFGGFGQNFQQGGGAIGSTTTTIHGTSASSTIALLADGISSPTTLSGMTFEGVDATTAGATTYAAIVRNSTSALTLSGDQFIAATAGSGTTGTSGTDAASLTATASMNGTNGDDAASFSVSCDSTDHGNGGAGGVGTGGAGSGGVGGAGGTMDTTCNGLLSDFDATPGATGGDGGLRTAIAGMGGSGGAGQNVCGAGSTGNTGSVSNGATGTSGSGGSFVGEAWAGADGGDGGVGSVGGGGGGGGGSGGCDLGVDAYGAGGGGGGAGGAAAVSGGGGGTSGGASIALLLDTASPTVTNVTITLGDGGAGGNGGAGGQGQSGGTGGAGGAQAGGGQPGGEGGHGGHGGDGGGGGGGAGGPAIGIAAHSSTSSLAGVAFFGGTAGLGGNGGVSAPNAPAGEQDGSNGAAGAPGLVSNSVTY
jgi:hypothetical protein